MRYIGGVFTLSGEPDWSLSDSGERNGVGITVIFRVYATHRRKDALNILNDGITRNEISWLHPQKKVTDEWIINFDELKNSFDFLRDLDWAEGAISIVPFHEVQEDEFDNKDKYSIIEFSIIPDEMEYFMNLENFPELSPFIERFLTDFPDPSRCGFIMMNFNDTKLHGMIVSTIKGFCAEYGVTVLRADEKAYSDELLPNIRTYMHACSFGIAVFERLASENFNPNVSLEVGYMMALGKPVLLLKDSTLALLPTDLVGRLYSSFDTQSPGESIPPILERWLSEKSIV